MINILLSTIMQVIKM